MGGSRRAHGDTGTACKLHTKRPAIEPTTFSLSDGGTNHCPTVSTKCLRFPLSCLTCVFPGSKFDTAASKHKDMRCNVSRVADRHDWTEGDRLYVDEPGAGPQVNLEVLSTKSSQEFSTRFIRRHQMIRSADGDVLSCTLEHYTENIITSSYIIYYNSTTRLFIPAIFFHCELKWTKALYLIIGKILQKKHPKPPHCQLRLA